MAYTSPRTWVTGEVVTSSIMNQHIRDNLLETAVAKVTTAGDIVQATAVNALARLAIGTAGQVLTVNAGATALAYSHVLLKGLVTSDFSAFNGSTDVDIPGMVVALEANSYYAIWGLMLHTLGTPSNTYATGKWTIPASTTLHWVFPETNTTINSENGSGERMVGRMSDNNSYLLFGETSGKEINHFIGSVYTGANAGNMQLIGKEITPDANNPTVHRGTFFIAAKLA